MVYKKPNSLSSKLKDKDIKSKFRNDNINPLLGNQQINRRTGQVILKLVAHEFKQAYSVI